jgi:hypothetical protein
MKKAIIKSLKLVSLVFIFVCFFSISCKELCLTGTGTLTLTNKSLHTVQKIMINGVNYGTIDPGESKDIELSPGTYYVEQDGISGGTGCSGFVVNMAACTPQGYSCSS